MTLANFKNKIKDLTILNWIEIIFFSICLLSIITISIVVKSSLLTIFFSIFAILYVAFLSYGLKITIIFGIIQCILYVIESFLNRNYGEAILNVGVVLPLLVFSCFSWIKGNDKQQQIKKNKISIKELLILLFCSLTIAVAFYFILKAFNTPQLILASLSVFFTIVGNYLLMRKSILMFFAFAILNLIALLIWLLPIIDGEGQSLANVPIVIVFIGFTGSNIFGLINWKKSVNNESVKNNEHFIENN